MNTRKNKQKLSKESTISAKDIDFQTPIRNFLLAMGEDPNRTGIKKTPERFEKTIKYLLGGYDRSFKEESSIFENIIKYNDIIALKNINFFSLCEHHLLPFFGYAHIAYIPSEKGYLGISKLARVVDIYARRLQDQERLGFQVAEALMKEANAKGVAVLLESKHLCVAARGVENKVTVMSTCAYYGSFKKGQGLQQQFIELVRDREKV